MLRARAVPKAPAALDPKPAPIGTSTWCLTVILHVLGAFCSSVSTTVLVVSASGQSFPLIDTLIWFSSDSVKLTSVWTPLLIPNPPPRAPIWFGLWRSLPSEVRSQISKKLEIPAGEKALAPFAMVLLLFTLWSQGRKGSVTDFQYRGSENQQERYLGGKSPDEPQKAEVEWCL